MIVNIESGKQQLLDAGTQIRTLEVSPRGDAACIVVNEGLRVRLWRLRDNSHLELGAPEYKALRCFFSPDGQVVLTASQNGGGKLWNTNNGTLLSTITAPQTVRQAYFSPRHEWVAILPELTEEETRVGRVSAGQNHCSPGYCTQVWQTSNGTLEAELPGHLDLVSSVSFHPTRPWIATVSSGEGVARIYTLASDELLRLAKLRWSRFLD